MLLADDVETSRSHFDFFTFTFFFLRGERGSYIRRKVCVICSIDGKTMASVYQSYTRWFSSTIRLVSRLGRATEPRRWCSHDGPMSSSQFGHSVILLQDGLNIEELPIAVRRANAKFLQLRSPCSSEIQKHEESVISDTVFKKCQSPEAVISELNDYNKEQVTAPVAYQALSKMAELGMNIEYRNQGAEIDKSFTSDAVLLQLGSTICTSGTADQLIGSLRLILLPSFPGKNGALRKQLAETCLNRVLDNVCSVVQVCQVIELFSAMSQPYWADKCWPGLMGRHIDGTDMLRVFQILPLLKESQRAVFNYLERLLADNMNQLDEQSVLRILAIVNELNLSNKRICVFASSWVRLNLHTLTEDGMAKLLTLFRRLNHSDQHLIRVMERFFISRGSGLQQELIAAAADYCRHFQFCSSVTLNVVAEGFSRLGPDKLNVRTIESVLTAFGKLDFRPDDEFTFWSTAEAVLDRKLVEFRPEALLDVLMSCVYLQRYPMNFIPRVFSAQFIHRIHSQTQDGLIELCRTKIKLLDSAMSFECGQYGPSHILPKDFNAKAMARDGRITRISGQLIAPLQEICGNRYIATPSVILRDLPLSPIYIIDVLVSPANEPVHFRYGNIRTHENRNCIAVLIHPPEHYTIHPSSKKRLVGVQAMRNRHLLLMGFRPVHLELEELVPLVNKKEMLKLYIDSRVFPLLNENDTTQS